MDVEKGAITVVLSPNKSNFFKDLASLMFVKTVQILENTVGLDRPVDRRRIAHKLF